MTAPAPEWSAAAERCQCSYASVGGCGCYAAGKRHAAQAAQPASPGAHPLFDELYCLAHSHSNRLDEALCSLQFQRAQATPAADVVERVAGPLRELLALIEGGWLVRSTANDAHFPSYLKESARLVKALAEAQQAIALADALTALQPPRRTG